MDIRVILVLFCEIRMGLDAVGDVDELDPLLLWRCAPPLKPAFSKYPPAKPGALCCEPLKAV
jgi:hypothetical protein